MSQEKKPNIVLVVMDTARAQNFSCYGHDRKTSPFLDSLAENNVKYENAFVQENWTLTSHASMFSGNYVSDHQITESMSFEDVDSFTSELEDRGYSTYGFSNVAFLTAEYDFDTLFDYFEYNRGEDFFSGIETTREGFRDGSGVGRYLNLIGDIASSRRFDKVFTGLDNFLSEKLFLKDSGAKETNRKVRNILKDQEDPFFLFLNYTEPHTPYIPPFPYSHKFLDNKARAGELREIAYRSKDRYLGTDEDPDEEFVQTLRNLYDGEINYLDTKLEELHDYISERFPDTVFIFTSDHGEYIGEHGFFDHGIGSFKEVKHVPLIEKFPDGQNEEIEKPVEIKHLCDHILKLSEGDLKPIQGKKIAFSEDIGSKDNDKTKFFYEERGYYGVSAFTENHFFEWYSSGKTVLRDMETGEEMRDEEKETRLRNEISDRFGSPENNSVIENEEIDPEDEKIKSELEKLGYL